MKAKLAIMPKRLPTFFWRCHQLLSGTLAKGHLSRVSCQSRLSVTGKGDDEIIPKWRVVGWVKAVLAHKLELC